MATVAGTNAILLRDNTMQIHSASAFVLLLLVAVAPASFGQADEHRHDQAAHSPEPVANPSALVAAPVQVQFPAQMREHTLANMRDHLSALAEIQGHIAVHRYNNAADIAEQRLGMSSLKLHGAHEVAKYMPKGMQDAGTAMHRAASKFALTAQESAVDNNMGKSVTALATLTQTCVACHAVYRLQ